MIKKLTGQIPTVVIAAATAAIFGGGGAYAAAQITSAQIQDQTIQSRDIAAEGVGTSEIRNQSIQSGDIGEGGVGQSEIRNGSVYHGELSTGLWTMIQDAASDNATQDTRIQDLEDAPGPDLSEYAKKADEDNREDISTARAGAGYSTMAKPGMSVAFNQCDEAGQVAISGGYRLNGHASEAFSGDDQNAMPDGLTVVATEPAAAKDGKLVNAYKDTTFPQTDDGAFQANAWAVTFKNTTDHDLPVRVWATCVSVD